ncbi:MAG: hypothetical protein SFW36_07555 [Leptolyngbyaceae cyanobacterium bins.59]|nr:hypothetical protein [Leptolyngbyaceae cyanobacterium bins.59]
MTDRESFFFPRSRYYGRFTPANLAFNANLQEFSQRVSLLANLETGGKISPDEAFGQIGQLWHQLERSHHKLGIGQSDSPA